MSESNIHPLALQLVVLQEQCFRAGLHKTAQSLSLAVDSVGWELSDLMANGIWEEGLEYYKKHRKRVQQMIKGDKSPYFTITPGYDMKHPGNWRASNWRWFINELKRKQKREKETECRQKILLQIENT